MTSKPAASTRPTTSRGAARGGGRRREGLLLFLVGLAFVGTGLVLGFGSSHASTRTLGLACAFFFAGAIPLGLARFSGRELPAVVVGLMSITMGVGCYLARDLPDSPQALWWFGALFFGVGGLLVVVAQLVAGRRGRPDGPWPATFANPVMGPEAVETALRTRIEENARQRFPGIMGDQPVGKAAWGSLRMRPSRVAFAAPTPADGEALLQRVIPDGEPATAGNAPARTGFVTVPIRIPTSALLVGWWEQPGRVVVTAYSYESVVDRKIAPKAADMVVAHAGVAPVEGPERL